jgi:subtilisin-like proprotein convertase family protein
MSKLEVDEMDLSNLTDVQLDMINYLARQVCQSASGPCLTMNRLATRIRKEREERALDWIYQETLKGEEAEGHWTCNVIQTEDSDHGPCSGYEIEELGITIFIYREDPTRISIHRETKK